MPAPIITMFQQGAFVVSVSGRSWHSVAIDECHEMLINKDCKTSIVKPLPDYINRIARYIPYRTKSVKNFQQQLLPCKKGKQTVINSAFSTRPNDIKCEQNIHAQIQALETSSMFTTPDTKCGLFNPFAKKEATAGQHHDLLNWRTQATVDIQVVNILLVSSALISFGFVSWWLLFLFTRKYLLLEVLHWFGSVWPVCNRHLDWCNLGVVYQWLDVLQTLLINISWHSSIATEYHDLPLMSLQMPLVET